MAEGTRALYHDQHWAEPRPVSVCIRNQIVFVEGAGVRRSTPLATVHLGEPWERRPRILRFSDGAYCEVIDPAGLQTLLTGTTGPAASSQWEAFPRSLLAVGAVILALLAALYFVGVPYLAGAVAARVPASLTSALTDDVVSALDGDTFTPTTLSHARQEELTRAFEGLLDPADRQNYTLLFRNSPQIGANALALPSGAIVITDQLVELTRDDREILGVLAHEAGHVARRHAVRLVLQDSAVALCIGWMVGDFTSVMAVAPAVLLQSKYSRDFEREADAYAADLLIANGIPPRMLADILERLETSRSADTAASPGSSSGHAPASGAADSRPIEAAPPPPSLLDYAASHPATRERLEYLRSR